MSTVRNMIVGTVTALLLAGMTAAQAAAAEAPPPPANTAAAASGEKPPPPTSHRAAAAATPSEDDRPVYRVDSGFDLDQYLFRESSPLDFEIEITDYYGPVDNDGHPTSDNPLHGKNALLTMRVYDVDAAEGEVDTLSVNGQQVDGKLTGADSQWATDTFTIPTSLLKFPAENGETATNKFAIDIDTTNDGWAVQVDWAELRTPERVLPAVFLHGITATWGPNAQESSMGWFKDYIVSHQPQLQDRAIAPKLTLNGSVGANVGILTPRVEQLLQDEPKKQIDIAAHSMGGLNARYYAFKNPDKVRKVMMIGTPNGGSEFADILCVYRHVPSYLNPLIGFINEATKNFGGCDDATNGLYQLQTSYMKNIFNKQVPDNPSVEYATIAGKKGGLGSFALPGDDDGTVSVNSVRYLGTETGRGLHTSLTPALEHDHMRLIFAPSQARPRTLCYLYPDLSECATTSAAAKVSAARLAAAAPTEWQPVVNSPSDVVPAGATRSYPIEVPTGQLATLIAMVDKPELTLSLSSGSFAPTTWFGTDVLAADFTGPVTLTAHNTGSTEASFATLLFVNSSRVLTLDVPTLTEPGGTLPIKAILTEPLPSDQVRYRISAADGTTVSEGDLTLTGTQDWATEVPMPPAGDYTVIAWVEGPQPRLVTRPLVIAPAGIIQPGFTQDYQDTNGNGLIDQLEVGINVTMRDPGTYQLAATIRSDVGEVVGTAGGQATLSAGPGVIRLQFDGAAIHEAAQPGPWHLADVTLSDDSLKILDTKTNLGPITRSNYAEYEHQLISVVITGDSGIDDDTNGTFERLELSGQTQVPATGWYAINAKLVAADGTEVGRTQLSSYLTAPTADFVLNFDGATIGATGKDGPFILRDLTIYPANNPSGGISLVDSYQTKPYLSSQFPGGGPQGMCAGLPATIVGTGGPITGTPGDDVILGTSGAESINAGAGNDVVCAGGGDDRVYGTDGNDRIYGGAGNDALSGGTGVDRVYAEDGNDAVYGGTGNDALSGGRGNDRIYGGAGWDSLHGGPGNDRLEGGPDWDKLDGGTGVNVLVQ